MSDMTDDSRDDQAGDGARQDGTEQERREQEQHVGLANAPLPGGVDDSKAREAEEESIRKREAKGFGGG